MTERKDDEGTTPDDLPADSTPENKSSGRVAFDARGNPIWEWQLESGVYSRDVDTNKLRKLELNELSLVDTGAHKKPAGPDDVPVIRKSLAGGGFNPYDTAPTSEDNPSPYDRARTAVNKKVAESESKSKAPPARRPVDLHKLDEWIKMKRRLSEAKQDDDDE